jgi:hypothetical protein
MMIRDLTVADLGAIHAISSRRPLRGPRWRRARGAPWGTSGLARARAARV